MPAPVWSAASPSGSRRRLGAMLVLPLAKKLTSTFPNIRLRFVEGFSAHLLEWLDNGCVDMAVLYQGWAAGRLLREKMITEKLCLIASTERKKLDRRTPAAELAQFSADLAERPARDAAAARQGRARAENRAQCPNRS